MPVGSISPKRVPLWAGTRAIQPTPRKLLRLAAQTRTNPHLWHDEIRPGFLGRLSGASELSGVVQEVVADVGVLGRTEAGDPTRLANQFGLALTTVGAE
jgi:hypothetical protein